MGRVMYVFMCVCLASMASAEVYTLQDGHSGNTYGATPGFGVDIDTTYNAYYDVPLVAGQQYYVDSVSIWEASDNATEGTVYLSVFGSTFGGFDGDTAAEHLGFSDNAVNLLASANGSLVTWTFSDLIVTAGSDGWLGDGLLYFFFDTDTQRNNWSSPQNAYHRMDGDADVTTAGASVYAYGTLQALRAPEVIISLTPLVSLSASYPNVTPLNGDGSVGSPVNATQAAVTLGWTAGGDPNAVTEYPVNPAILGHNIYLSHGIAGDDPNVYLLDYIEQVHNADPYLTNPYNQYGPFTLQRGVTYYWQIEEVIDSGSGVGYGAGDPNNIMSRLWSFTVVPATVNISAVSPAYSAVEAGATLELSVTATAADSYQWYRIGTPDEPLTNGADYSGVDTDTLTILGVQVADEGSYYCVVENSLPSTASNRDTGPGRVLTKRLMSHYPMETMDYGSDAKGLTVDLVSGVYDMRMASNDAGSDVPVLDSSSKIGANALMFDNPAAAGDPNVADAQYAVIENGNLVAYEDISISVWVYSNGGTAWNRIVDFGNDTANYIDMAMNWWGSPGRVGCEIMVDGTAQSVVSPAGALASNEWTLITVTLSGDSLRLYLDGELAAGPVNAANDPILFAPTAQNWLGRSQWGAGDGYFDGLIDDLKIYNYGLTSTEVGQKYLADETLVTWVCDWEAYNQDSMMRDLDIDNNCEINLTDFAAFAGRWLDDTYQITLP